MAVAEMKQRPDPLKKGPGPDHTPGDWTMRTAERDRSAFSMTHAQAKTLKSLAREGREPDAFMKNLSEEGAEIRIRILQAKIAKDKSGRQHKPD